MTSLAAGALSSHSARKSAEPTLTENARKVLEARYLKKAESGECTETPGDLFDRVAATLSAVERQYGGSDADQRRWHDRFYNLMATGDFMPNSPTLMNAGREMGMLSACFVLPVRDSITDIFDSIKHTALIQKAGGGTGFAFDELRPTGDFISSSGGTTSGPISFWRAFSEATNAIQQGAFRRGANMGMMYVHHPDIMKFLHAKQDLSQFTNYNISVKITDTWMSEFNADPDSPHVVRNPRSGQCYLIPRNVETWKYDVRSLETTDQVEPVPAGEPGAAYYTSPKFRGAAPAEWREKYITKRDIWDIIIKNAWQTGEPGVVFIDRINEVNPTPHVGRIEATNPCGEQPLLPYEACNLGSINLGNFITNPCTSSAGVNWDALRECVHLSTRFLDNVIDANVYPLPEIDAVCKANRKIGLGIMGFADALYKLGVAYNSDQGVEWGERFMRFVNDEAHNYSEHLARVRGCFPNWKGSIWDTRHQRMMRNSATTTVAPTGTISIIANCSGGIEPMFSLAFFRNVLRGQKQGEKPLVEVNDTFRQVAAARGFLSDELLDRLASEGTLHHIDGIPEDIQRVFVCAHDIAPVWHMRMQAAFQRHNDSSISKTINFANDATPAEVDEIYRLAFDMRCKGVTVYRDGCRNFQPMALKDSGKKHETASVEAPAAAEPLVATVQTDESAATVVMVEAPAAANGNGNGNGNGHAHAAPSAPAVAASSLAAAVVPVVQAAEAAPVRAARPDWTEELPLEPQDLPEIVSGLRIRQMTPFGNMHVKITVDLRRDRELEVFAQLGKGGDVATSDLEAICRMISLWLRSGGSLRHVIKQLEGIGSSLQIPTKAGRIMSLGDGLACALKKYSRAKERFGLRSLLLGDVDLANLDSPIRPQERGGSPVVGGTSSPVGGGAGGGGGRLAGITVGTSAAGVVAAVSAAVAALPAAAAQAAVRTPANQTAAVRALSAGAASVGGSGSENGGGAAVLVAEDVVLERISTERVEEVLYQAGLDRASLDQAAADSAALNQRASIVDAVELDESVAGSGLVAAVEERIETSVSSITRVTKHFHDSAQHYKVHCPDCAAAISFESGCKVCHGCGWSAC